MPATKEDRAFYRQERLEQHQLEQQTRLECERREDIESERGLWAETVSICLQNECPVSMAIDSADRVLEAYKARFS
jgi:hypothetical protein